MDEPKKRNRVYEPTTEEMVRDEARWKVLLRNVDYVLRNFGPRRARNKLHELALGVPKKYASHFRDYADFLDGMISRGNATISEIEQSMAAKGTDDEECST
jgi:hypothetical protein